MLLGASEARHRELLPGHGGTTATERSALARLNTILSRRAGRLPAGW